MPRLEDYDGPPRLYTEPVRGYRLFAIRDKGLTRVLSPIVIPGAYQVHDRDHTLPEAYCAKLNSKDPFVLYAAKELHNIRYEIRMIPRRFEDIAFLTDNPSPSALVDIRTEEKEITDPAPVESCTCGYWAVYDPTYAPDAVRVPPNTFVVMCAVEATGIVVLGTKGFRTQKLKITGVVNDRAVFMNEWASITDPNIDPGSVFMGLYTRGQTKMIEQVLRGVPFINNLEAHVKEFPVTRPEDYGG